MTNAGCYLWVAIGLIGLGVILLILSIVPVRAIIRQLPAGAVRSRWRILSGLIFIFIVGYALYALLLRQDSFTSMAGLVVPGIFFGGAIFVFLVCSLSLTTTHDLRQMYVLEQESITDCLMGIYNRRYLERRLAEEVQRAKRYDLPFSIFLLDIDHFKKVNDTYGHQVGDSVLKKLGAVIVDSVREMDVVIRYGGEEILVILPKTEEKNAIELAERLRQKIEDTIMVEPDPEQGRRAIYITVSIGVAGFRLTGGCDTDRRMLERADRALYQAKHHGRDRVESCEDSDDLA
jgi:diguanylate cyclase (GGDEF)-like protein